MNDVNRLVTVVQRRVSHFYYGIVYLYFVNPQLNDSPHDKCTYLTQSEVSVSFERSTVLSHREMLNFLSSAH